MQPSKPDLQRILFVTRKFPPSVGGMETAAFELHYALQNGDGQVDLVAWGRGKKWLPVGYLLLFSRALVRALVRQPDVILLQDGAMAPLGWALKLLTRRPTLAVIHGLEVTHKNVVYRLLVLPFIKRQTAFAAVSTSTKQAAIDVLGSAGNERVEVIPNGVRDMFYSSKSRDEQLRIVAYETKLPLQRLQRCRILVTTGRLIERKGVGWFIDNVMSRLVVANPNLLYLVAGSGPQRASIELAIDEHALTDNVKLLGKVSHECLKALYGVADVFIMPNVRVGNDIEGFGLVALEAASCGTLVVASDLEGISDAVIHGKNGYLVQPGDVSAYTSVVRRELAKRTLSASAVRRYTLERYSWAEAAKAYRSLAWRTAFNDGICLKDSPDLTPNPVVTDTTCP